MLVLKSCHFQLLFLCLFANLFANLLWISTASANKDPFAIRISCGAREDVRTTNVLWYRDFGYTGGRIANATRSSFIVPPLNTLRYFPLSDGSENCYNINNIPNGHYAVRVFFGLIADANLDNEPVFDISIEGTQIDSLKPGWSNSEEQSFTEALVFITDRSVSFCFHSTGHGDPSILSIEILQVDANAYNFGPLWDKGMVVRTTKRLSCGSGKPAFDEDYNGNHWGGDRFWLGTSTFDPVSVQSISTENRITQASIAPNFYPEKLYQSAIVSTDRQPELSFQMEVDPNKNYSLWLHFAEIDTRISSAGQRIFDILVNGDIAFKSVDIIHITGKHNAALVLNRTIAVSGRVLTITFRPTKGNHAIINAIEVFEVISAEFRTSPEEVKALQVLKNSLELPLRFGWNGDPCAPRQHPWSGIDCQFDTAGGKWNIDGLGLDNQGLRGFLPNDISKLRHLQTIGLDNQGLRGFLPNDISKLRHLQTIGLDNQGLRGFLPNDISKLRHLQTINLSGNSIHGSIPPFLGAITGLEALDLSYNQLNGSIPESLGQLQSLKILNLNGNSLSGRVPAKLGGRPLHGASFNFTGNAGLCGIPGLPSCGPHLSIADKIGIAIGALVASLLLVVYFACWWKRRQNILRAQKIAASAREAPYAKARTHFVRDVQMTRPQRIHDQSRNPIEGGPHLLS